MASYHLHREDKETGKWACGGPYKSMKDAEGDAKRIMDNRERNAQETWYLVPGKFGEMKAWENNRGDRLYVKEH